MEKDAGNWWLAEIKAVRGCHTQGRTIEQTLRRIEEALEVCGVNPASVQLVPVFKLPKKALEVLSRSLEARNRAEAEQARAQTAVKQAAQVLAGLGMSRRDAGSLLGLSHQRVQQLLQEA